MSDPYTAPSRHEDEPSLPQLAGKVRTLQTITGAMLMGVLAFILIALLNTEGVFGDEPKLISWIAIGFAGLMFVQHLFLPGLIAKMSLSRISRDSFRNANKDEQHELLFPAYQTRHIVACAMLEGGVFFNLVSYMVTEFGGNLMTAWVQASMIAIRFPTVTRAQFWIQDRTRELELS